jgi:hypothetical protein
LNCYSKNAGLLYKKEDKFSKISCLHGLGGLYYLNFSVITSILAISGGKWGENVKNAVLLHKNMVKFPIPNTVIGLLWLLILSSK